MEKNHEYAGPISFLRALGAMTALSLQSSLHRAWSVGSIEDNYLPALMTGQCKIYFAANETPSAFVTWALLDDATHEQMKADMVMLEPEQWTSGGNLWFMDIVAPYGNAKQIVRDMQRNHFPNQNAWSLKRDADGSMNRVKIWRNVPTIARPVITL